MKVIIAGGRDFDNVYKLHKAMQQMFGPFPEDYVTEVVSGGARGADTIGEHWAKSYERIIKKFVPDWNKHGRSAGMIRNAEMAKYADMLVAFWDGESKGTKHMIDIAIKSGIEVHVYRYKNVR